MLTTHSCPDINECDSGPCLNGGTCVDGAYSYTCQCPPDVYGTNCENGTQFSDQ